MTSLARSRYQKGHEVWFLDLKKAFYRIRQGGKRVSYLKFNGLFYKSSRIIFGVQHGPSSLYAATLLMEQLAYAVFDIIMELQDEESVLYNFRFEDKPVHRDDIEITLAYFFDDFMISGPPLLVEIFKRLLGVGVTLIGFEFPPDKMSMVEVDKPERHLGSMWSLTQDLSLRIDCINPEDVPATEILPLTKRRVFQHTGRLHETTREHGVTDYIKNALKMWAGF
ncbi:hypothetical protein FOZ63_015793 [Perkinsus olseni]|uniref:Reverse transcriptase domain-containing protein n=1 Tax=Perkinsus olseni TaxID=32597 RepID=A0A7J6RAD4_PEROL|nr:hypothetical protein FOZ63_015793 [Perkinsus olseni]KAF4717332.1 hypothetical protein FOZ62_016786 [Perkinsus olseni]